MPRHDDAPRDLLFGLLALQNGMVTRDQLVMAFTVWTAADGKPLADLLAEQGALRPEHRPLLDALAEAHLKLHGGDPAKSLAALDVNRSTRESLVNLGDPGIEATLGHVPLSHGSTEDGDADRTASYAVGTATSDGQRFRVLRPHARGGLGAVFVALDGELNREVALKQILDHHADDATSRQRFLIEAEVTGGLEHPGIVPVYGLGTYGDGRPFYAMRFIRGDSLKEAIERFHTGESLKKDPGRRSLELRKLLRRFLDVCNAIDYAHSRGVLHRDIKPGNIIVGKHGETLVVDWGLAKATGRAEPGAEERTLMPSSASGSAETLPGSALGTPAYMSPEQARGELESLGPRSDVYSLGATLYCLLTGKPPQEGEDLGAVLRRVQRGEFAPPGQLDPSLDRALEAICLKAMALRPEDRYASGRALADELERWMADEPVAAYAEPWTRTLTRWLSRHRTGVTAAGAAVLVALVGTAAVLAVQSVANARLSQSLRRETRARQDLAMANEELTRSKQAVQARYDLAVDAIKTFHTGVSEDFLLKQDQFKALRDRLLKSAQDFYGKLSALLGRDTDLDSRRALAATNFELAELTAKVGRIEDALAAHRKVLAAREDLTRGTGAGSAVDVGRSLLAIAGLLETTGAKDESLATYRRAEALLEDTSRTDRSALAALAEGRFRMGMLLRLTGRDDEALPVFERAKASWEAAASADGASAEARIQLLESIYRIVSLQLRKGRRAEAELACRQAMEIQGGLVAEVSDVTGSLTGTKLDVRSRLARGYLMLGTTLAIMPGRKPEAEAAYRQAIKIQERLAAEHHAVAEIRLDLAEAHQTLGSLLTQTDRPAEAESAFRRAIAIHAGLAAENPGVTAFRSNLATQYNHFGWMLDRAGRSTPAVAEYRHAIELYARLAADHPAVTKYRGAMALCHNNAGWLLLEAGDLTGAVSDLEKARELYRALAEADPSVPEHRNEGANVDNNLAVALRRLGRAAESRDHAERAVIAREHLVREKPDWLLYRSGLAENLLNRGLARRDLGELTGAAADLRQAVDLYRSMSENMFVPESYFLYAGARASLSSLAGRAGSGVSDAEAADAAAAAMSLLRQAIRRGYRNLDAYRTDDTLDPLRGRADFQLLMMDVVFPAEPFAR